MTILTPTQVMLADLLFSAKAIQFGAFKLKLHEKDPEAPLSPIYLNLRTPENPKPGPLVPEIMDMIGGRLAMAAVLDKLAFNHVMGIPNAGDPFAEIFAKKYKGEGWEVPSLLKMTKENLDDDKRRIGEVTEGRYLPGDTVLMIDDLITKADSKLEAIKKAEEVGLIVRDVRVLVDREQGGADQLREYGYRLHTVFNLSSLLDYYVEKKLISQEKADEVMTYVRGN